MFRNGISYVQIYIKICISKVHVSQLHFLRLNNLKLFQRIISHVLISKLRYILTIESKAKNKELKIIAACYILNRHYQMYCWHIHIDN